MRLDESFKNQCSTFNKVLCASSYGHFIARQEFVSQCHILLLLMSGGPRADELDLVNCPQEATPETMRG